MVKPAKGSNSTSTGGSPTSTKTATSTKTSTVANPKGNVTVTGGAGDGDTTVFIGQESPDAKNSKKGREGAHERPSIAALKSLGR